MEHPGVRLGQCNSALGGETYMSTSQLTVSGIGMSKSLGYTCSGEYKLPGTKGGFQGHFL